MNVAMSHRGASVCACPAGCSTSVLRSFWRNEVLLKSTALPYGNTHRDRRRFYQWPRAWRYFLKIKREFPLDEHLRPQHHCPLLLSSLRSKRKCMHDPRLLTFCFSSFSIYSLTNSPLDSRFYPAHLFVSPPYMNSSTALLSS